MNSAHLRLMTTVAVILVAAIVFGASPAAADAPLILKWGGTGTGDGQFDGPEGIALDSSGNVYVTDFFNHRVQKFTATGGFLIKWGSLGAGDGQFINPYGIAIDAGGNVLVADRGNHRIQKFTSAGAFLGWLGKCTGGANCDVPNQRSMGFNCTAATCSGLSSGAGDGQFDDALGIAVDGTGSIYVTDQATNRVQKFTSAGVFLLKWGTPGSGDGQLSAPLGIAVDASGSVYVGDAGNNRIQKFTNTGSFLLKWGTAGTGNGQFLNGVSFLAVDSSGFIYAADNGNRIQKFTNVGGFVASWGSSGSGDGQFDGPRGIAIAPNGKEYVSDLGNDRVQLFGPVTLEELGGASRPNVGGAIAGIEAAAAQARENRARVAAAVPTLGIAPPSTGTGITPPNTGDAGLAARSRGRSGLGVTPIATVELLILAGLPLAKSTARRP